MDNIETLEGLKSLLNIALTNSYISPLGYSGYVTGYESRCNTVYRFHILYEDNTHVAMADLFPNGDINVIYIDSNIDLMDEIYKDIISSAYKTFTTIYDNRLMDAA